MKAWFVVRAKYYAMLFNELHFSNKILEILSYFTRFFITTKQADNKWVRDNRLHNPP